MSLTAKQKAAESGGLSHQTSDTDLESDQFLLNQHPDLTFFLRMIFSANRFPLFGIIHKGPLAHIVISRLQFIVITGGEDNGC